MKDLETREDIELLVDKFYDKVKEDEVIGFFFNNIAKVDWSLHLPKMYRFWESLLFAAATYKGNPMAAHFPINEISSMEKNHFEHWLGIWCQTIDENFSGSMSETAKYKAANIANLMAYKMEMARKPI